MNGFFNLDGPFYKWGTEVADVMILSLLWLICSIPIFTLGASTTALFYVYGKKVRGEDPYIVKSFFSSFKDNFKQATVLTFILGLLWFSVYLYYQIIISGGTQIWIQIMGLFFMIQVIIVTQYVFPVLSRFDMPIKNIIISSFIFGNKHLPTTILCSILFGVFIIAVTSPTPLMIFAFGIYALATSYLFQRVFTKYIEPLQEREALEAEEAEEAQEIENAEEEEDEQ